MNTINCNGHLLDFSTPIVMGVLNATPDSFYDGGLYNELNKAMKNVSRMISEGATIIDVGGMSSRPGAEIIAIEEEKRRVLPIISAIKIKYPNQIISIDTVHSEVAAAAISSGASIVNDISGGDIDPNIYNVCMDNNVPYILMHMKGLPSNMQDDPQYENVLMEVLTKLKNKVFQLRKMGMKDIILDPGFGFGKSIEQNYSLLKGLSVFRILDCPILAGVSRKSMIYKLLDTDASHALNGTTAAHMVALINNAKVLRVHDVKEAVECIKVYTAVYA